MWATENFVGENAWKSNYSIDFSFLRLFAGLYVILGGSIRTVKENIEALLVASKEIGLEVNAEKT
jgi:hypothetical protein